MYRVSEYDNKRYDLQYRPRNDPDLTAGKSLQAGKGTKPLVLITRVGSTIGKLPKAGEHSSWYGSNTARVPGDDQGVISKSAIVTRACVPPVKSCVNHRISTRLGLVRVTKVMNPTDHRRGRETIASVTRWSVFDVQHAGKRLAVRRPATTVREEKVGLRSARGGIRVSEMISAADETGRGCAIVVGAKVGIRVRRALIGKAGCQMWAKRSQRNAGPTSVALMMTKRAPLAFWVAMLTLPW